LKWKHKSVLQFKLHGLAKKDDQKAVLHVILYWNLRNDKQDVKRLDDQRSE